MLPRLFQVVFLTLGGAALIGCNGSRNTPAKAQLPGPAVTDPSAGDADLPAAATGRRGPLLDPIVVRDCLLTVTRRQDVPTQRDGAIEEILVKEGQEVEKNQLLARLDARLATADRDIKKAKKISSEARLEAATKTKDEAFKRAENSQKLFNKGVYPAEQLALDRLTYDKYFHEEVAERQNVELAKQELKQAEIVLKYYEIRASIPGVVKSVLRQEGEAVKNLDSLFHLHNLDRLRVEGLVDIQNLPRLQRSKKLRAVIEYSRQEGHELPLTGHFQEVTGVAVNKDPARPLIVSASADNSVRVWDRKERRELRTLSHPVPVRAVACTGPRAAEDWCVSVAADGKARLWDLKTLAGRPLREFAAEGGHRGPLTSVVFSPDGKLCATGGEDQEICLWETATGQLLHKLPKVHRGPVTSLQFAVDGQLVSAAQDNTVALWKVADGKAQLVRQTPPARLGDVTTLGVSPDGKRVLFDQGRTLRVLSLPDGATEATLQNPSGGANFTTFALFSPDGRLILTAGGSGGRLQLWRAPDLQTRAFEIRQLVSIEKSTCAAFAPDGSFLVTGTRDRGVLIWPVPTAKEDLDRLLPAEVTLVEPDVQSTGRQVRIWAEVDNPKLDGTFRLLQPGTTATMVIYDE
jgi:WD40 repeat protein